ncbi:glycosyltransferase family 4 protein [Metabacillus rhizolycopersici]|uniref:Glycosyltransferase family 4 protein n=1 Tax=Metabacillus rhizolycopersici TaxID=2875709 RepID=A0ABS7UL67_9BACI|nr:glycosyltransferase family 4 protein [Metabacillus rhizolycopersici]MBZ5749053.1 glycosyltransferase family 4 protein [Metabacillus rhizolycopersici]
MSKKKKITFVINYFYPDLASTGQLMTELCLDLQHDFDITVVAAQPGYAGEKANTSKLFEVNHLENVKVTRIRLPEVDKTSKVSRLKYILSYFILANIALLREKKIDIIYTISQPPVLGGLIGTIGKLFKRTKHVYNIQDFNPEQAEAVSYTDKQIVFKIAKSIDKLNCRYSDHIVLVGNDMAETLKKRFDYNNVPIHSVINNWTNEDQITPLDKNNSEVDKFLNEHNLKDKFIVMYSGNLGLYYDLENIIKITKTFKDYSDLVFLFIGEGAVKEGMQQFTKENNIKNVLFLPYQPKDFIKYSLNAADVHLVVNQKGIKGVSVPSKIYGVMAAGKPILGVLEQGSEAQRLIDESNSGVVVEPQDYQGIIDSINYFYELSEEKRKEMGLCGRFYLERNLKRETSINKYKKLLNNL